MIAKIDQRRKAVGEIELMGGRDEEDEGEEREEGKIRR